ncbi:AraC family transcriptional regulator [Erythrobacter sp. WG]|uniref:AraC family transcriptional regulator n=1 Tax=Erythrobacter sp. WG TaxID=2985510 RepID=UPI002270079F|nr:AraC family transcriptional regulator [Erythrobacter sp. WG]
MHMSGLSAFPDRQHPLAWRDWATSPRTRASEPRAVGGAIVQRWESSARRMEQPPLDHHYLVVHLGGDKRVTRTGGSGTLVREVRHRGYSTIEAGQSYSWRTEGPIAFGHIYLEPRWFAETIGANFERDPARIELQEEVGAFDPLIGQLLSALVHAGAADNAGLMQQEAALEAVLFRLFERQAAAPIGEERMLITAASVRRVRDYIAAHLDSALTLDELARIAGYSRFHFARGFRAATGLPPYAYLLRQRIARACEMLESRDVPISGIAAATGFATHAQFSSRFRQVTGIAPSAYREMLR